MRVIAIFFVPVRLYSVPKGSDNGHRVVTERVRVTHDNMEQQQKKTHESEHIHKHLTISIPGCYHAITLSYEKQLSCEIKEDFVETHICQAACDTSIARFQGSLLFLFGGPNLCTWY